MKTRLIDNQPYSQWDTSITSKHLFSLRIEGQSLYPTGFFLQTNAPLFSTPTQQGLFYSLASGVEFFFAVIA